MNKPIVVAATSLGAAVLALAPLAGATAEAGAERGTVATKVDLSPNFTTPGNKVVFKGEISSKNAKCVGGRTVVLKSKADGTRYGTDRTDRNGKFKISFSRSKPEPSDAKITATAKEKKIGKLTCAAGAETQPLSAG